MTPAQLTAIGAVLLDLRDWLRDQDPGSLDAELVDAVVDVVARTRAALVEAGA